MKFVCERCHTKYSIADEKVRGKVLKVRCKTCTNVITVRETGASIELEVAAESSAPRDAPVSRSGGFDAGGGDGDTVVSPRGAAFAQMAAASRTTGKASGHSAKKAAAPLPEEALFAPSAPVAAPPPRRTAPPPPPVPPEVDWFLAIDGAQTGPFTRARLIDKILATGKDADVHVWAADFDGWKPPKDVPALQNELSRRRHAPPAPPPASRRPSSSGMPVAAAAGGAVEGGLMTVEGEAAAKQLHKRNGVIAANAAAAAAAVAQPGATAAPSGPFGDLLSGHTPAATLAHAASADAGLMLTPGPAAVGKMAPAAATPGRARPIRLVLGALGVVVVLCGIVSVWMFRRPATTVTTGEPTTPKAVATDFNAMAAQLKAEQEQAAAKSNEKTAAPVAPPESKVVIAHLDPPPRTTKGKQSKRKNQLTPPPLSPSSGTLTAEQREAANRFGESTGRELRVPTVTAATSARSTPAQADISRVINNNKAGIQTCYQRALLRDNTLTNGKVTVRVSIGLSGKVRSVNLDAPVQFRTLEPCIREVMSRWAFPPSSEEYGTEFPVVLQGNQ